MFSTLRLSDLVNSKKYFGVTSLFSEQEDRYNIILESNSPRNRLDL
jgi:hypothetical protein